MSRPTQTNRAFGIMFGIVFVGVAAIAWLFFDAVLIWALGLAAIFTIVALWMPMALLPLNRFWSWFGHGFGRLNNMLLLGIFYYLIIAPVGLVMRILGHDPLARQVERGRNGSYLRPVGRQTTSITLKDMF